MAILLSQSYETSAQQGCNCAIALEAIGQLNDVHESSAKSSAGLKVCVMVHLVLSFTGRRRAILAGDRDAGISLYARPNEPGHAPAS